MSGKTEPASQYKLKKAREKGQINKSQELNHSILYVAFVGVTYSYGSKFIAQVKNYILRLWSSPISTLNKNNLEIIYSYFFSILACFLGVMAILASAIILSACMQGNLVWSLHPLRPDWQRMHPGKRWKNIISIDNFIDFLKNMSKQAIALLLIFLLFNTNKKLCQHFSQLSLMDISSYVLQWLSILTTVFFLQGIIDKLYRRWKFLKDQRMSKQELKDEYRQREGDPKTKLRIRQLQQQIRQKFMAFNQIKTADMLITNPTHIAIALKYDQQTMPAPKLVFKTQGEQTEQAKNIARRHEIPIIENKTLARALFAEVSLNAWISPSFYPMIALLYRNLAQEKKSYDT